MGLRLIRQSSDTPSVSNTDDARMVRYAYGGDDGVVKNYGTELAPTISGSTLKIGSGCVVLHGWEVVLDANGYDVAVDNIDVLRYYSVYLEINLATESFDIKTLYDTAGYPEVETGEDLTAHTTGTARLLLYQFTAKAGVIENVAQKFSIMEYLKAQMQAVQNKFDGVEKSFTNVNQTITTLQNRLNVLGFKQAVISGAESGSQVTRQGNYVIGHIKLPGTINYYLDLYNIGYSSHQTKSLGAYIYPKQGDPYNTFHAKQDIVGTISYYVTSATYDTDDQNPNDALNTIYNVAVRLSGNSLYADFTFNTLSKPGRIYIKITDIYLGYEAVAL